MVPGLLGLWRRWDLGLPGAEGSIAAFGVMFGLLQHQPPSDFDGSRLSSAAFPGHAHAHRGRNPVSHHKPAGVGLPLSPALD